MNRYTKKIRFSILIAAGLIFVALLCALFSHIDLSDDNHRLFSSESAEKQTLSSDEEFEAYMDDLFCQEISASALSLHYTLADPSTYGITEYNTTLDTYSVDTVRASAALSENISACLKEFDQTRLSAKNRLTLDVLNETLYQNIVAATFPYYEEPLRPSTGDQAELPILLAEYTFSTPGDVNDYLEILASIPAYFDSICSYEEEKYDRGLFMADFAADTIISQCRDFASSCDSNYLIYTFDEKINTLDGLTTNQKIAYKNQNKAIILEKVLPAYERIADTLTRLSTACQTENSSASQENISSSGSRDRAGLCYLPRGREYYEYLVRKYTGSSDSVDTLQKRTEAQRISDLTEATVLLTDNPALEDELRALENMSENTSPSPSADSTDTIRTFALIQSSHSGTSQETASQNLKNTILTISETENRERSTSSDLHILSQSPDEMLATLKEKIKTDFPDIQDCNYTIKYVDETMEEYLAPAFYLTSPLDYFTENSIYINKSSNYQGLSLFTTLAHEGYPGHLYQNVAFCSTDPSPIRLLLGPAGYTEGWATYVEMLSYHYAGLSEDLADALSLEESAILSLYASADMGIHYDGWSFEQTCNFFSGYGFTDRDTIDEIFQLIVEEPAHYLKYYIGYLEFLSLKSYAQKLYDSDYSDLAFHQAILEMGPADFSVLKEYLPEYYHR